MASGITLSAGVRQNLLSLQKTADLMSTTQNRLATGKKVNSALDNPVNFFTSSSLQSRSSDLSSLLDSMSNGIKTLEAADNGLSSITSTLQSMKSTLQQARQDKSFQTGSYTIDTTTIGTATVKTIGFAGGAVSGSQTVNLNTTGAGSAATAATESFAFGTTLTFDDPGDELNFTIAVDGATPGTAVTINAQTLVDAGIAGTTIDDGAEMRTALTQALTDAGVTGVTVGGAGANFSFTSNTTGASSEIDISAVAAVNVGGANTLTNTSGLAAANDLGDAAVAAGAVKTVDALVTEINANASLQGKVVASNDGGKLRIQNLSTADLTVTGIGSDGELDGTTGTATIDGNDVRKNLVKQFNELRDQLDKLADDASFGGINLLRGDKLKMTFNETGTSTLEIQAKDINGNPTSINAANLNIFSLVDADVDADSNIDGLLNGLTDALGTIRSHASNFGSNLSIVENRTDFTKAMVNTLQTGADNLVLADTNEEAANMLALQTRQQLSSTALSLASQADQAVLRLFG
jgi:flagellin